jgi:hypothetical protein
VTENENILEESSTCCSLFAHQAGEQLFATATRVEAWLLLEYTRTWKAKAVEESDLSGAVKARLAELSRRIPGTRVQFIKSLSPSERGQITCYLALAGGGRPALSEIALSTYDDLLALDLEALLSGSAVDQRFERRDSLFVVCTNGKRDSCCARFGLPVYATLATYAGRAAWQTTHVGGHRFAPNLLCFPHGVFYGRVNQTEVDTIVEMYRSGEIYLEKYRGLGCYPEPVQAADYFLRSQTGIRSLSAYRFEDLQEIERDQWSVIFAETDSDRFHGLRIIARAADFATYSSCREAEPSQPVQYQLGDYQMFQSNSAG